MSWIRAIQHKLPKHKYAINAKLLGDDAECAWTNLGYWDDQLSSYPQACQRLAQHLAQSVDLNSNDRVLDLGCGHGASLKYWLEHFQIQDLEAVELQKQCVEKIQNTILQKNTPQIQAIHCQSFLNLNAIPFAKKFDVVLCIDAAYHSELSLFLNSIHSVLNSNGRVGFHALMLSDKVLNSKQKMQYRYGLKLADINFDHVLNQAQIQQSLQQEGFENIEIVDFSHNVLLGFSAYIESQDQSSQRGLEQFKINMTAKLCQKLARDGVVKYVQISAVKSDNSMKE